MSRRFATWGLGGICVASIIIVKTLYPHRPTDGAMALLEALGAAVLSMFFDLITAPLLLLGSTTGSRLRESIVNTARATFLPPQWGQHPYTDSPLLACLLAARRTAGPSPDRHFFSAGIELTQSNGKLLVLLGVMVYLAIVLAQTLQKVFFGQLRNMEIEHLQDKLGIAVVELFFAMALFRDEFDALFVARFVTLIIVKSFHWIVQLRVDFMDQFAEPPPVRWLSQIISVFTILFVFDLAMICYIVNYTLVRGPSMLIVFAFEYAVMLALITYTIGRFILGMLEITRYGGRWSDKSLYGMYLELVHDFVSLLTYFAFFAVVVYYYYFPLYIIRDLYFTTRSFWQGIQRVIQYKRATANMDVKYPRATKADLEHTDGICVICREDMLPAKVSVNGLGPDDGTTNNGNNDENHAHGGELNGDSSLRASSAMLRDDSIRGFAEELDELLNVDTRVLTPAQIVDRLIETLDDRAVPISPDIDINTVGDIELNLPALSLRHTNESEPNQQTLEAGTGQLAENTQESPPEYETNPKLFPRRLICGHIFHTSCLKSWLERQQTCPTCRKSVLEDESVQRQMQEQQQQREQQEQEQQQRQQQQREQQQQQQAQQNQQYQQQEDGLNAGNVMDVEATGAYSVWPRQNMNNQDGNGESSSVIQQLQSNGSLEYGLQDADSRATAAMLRAASVGSQFVYDPLSRVRVTPLYADPTDSFAARLLVGDVDVENRIPTLDSLLRDDDEPLTQREEQVLLKLLIRRFLRNTEFDSHEDAAKELQNLLSREVHNITEKCKQVDGNSSNAAAATSERLVPSSNGDKLATGDISSDAL